MDKFIIVDEITQRNENFFQKFYNSCIYHMSIYIYIYIFRMLEVLERLYIRSIPTAEEMQIL